MKEAICYITALICSNFRVRSVTHGPQLLSCLRVTRATKSLFTFGEKVGVLRIVFIW